MAVVATFRPTWKVFKTTAIPHQTNYKGTSGNRTRANMFSDIPQQTECTARVEKPALEETRLWDRERKLAFPSAPRGAALGGRGPRSSWAGDPGPG